MDPWGKGNLEDYRNVKEASMAEAEGVMGRVSSRHKAKRLPGS